MMLTQADASYELNTGRLEHGVLTVRFLVGHHQRSLTQLVLPEVLTQRTSMLLILRQRAVLNWDAQLTQLLV